MDIKMIIRLVVSVLAGYILMVLLLVLVQEVTFGGVSFTESDKVTLALAGIGSILSAAAGGALASWISKHPKLVPQAIMSVMVTVETTFLLVNNKTIDPLWFDILAAGSLIVGIVLGGLWLLHKRKVAVAK